MTKDTSISDVVKTRELCIYDDQDRLRIALSAHGGVDPKIAVYKEDGTPAIEIYSLEEDQDSRRIIFYGKRNTFRMIITSNQNGVGATLYDLTGRPIGGWGMKINEETGEYESI